MLEMAISEPLDLKIFWGGMPPDPPRRRGLTPAYYSSTICLLQILLKTLGKIEMLYNFFASFYLKMRFEETT